MRGTKEAGFVDKAEFEKVKRNGDIAIKNWIDNQLIGTSVTVVLIGKETLDREYVKYEIQESYKRGNAILAVIDKTEDRNKLTRKNFQQTDLTQVQKPDGEYLWFDENPAADNLRYELVENSNNEFVATKFSDNFLSTFSDSLKSGYYRYQANLWGISIGLTALAIAYVFSAFVIITAILELAFKRVLGVLVFATDIETGQRSKVVLSDILQCYLTVGFQGFGLSMFAMFINFLNAGQGISTNIFIKTIAYICAVFVLIKGSLPAVLDTILATFPMTVPADIYCQSKVIC
ncbi:hypothetical protein EfmAA242_06460 [Enterococcus faecium]|nr:hypothetical protein EfmAA242_06460 [Enterococcus faecium]